MRREKENTWKYYIKILFLIKTIFALNTITNWKKKDNPINIIVIFDECCLLTSF